MKQATQQKQMKKFNEVISIEIEIDAIAQKLLNTFPEDYPHREMLTEAIIATSMNNRSIAYIYNALNGFSNDVDFHVNQVVNCKAKAYNYIDEDNETLTERQYVHLGWVKIVEIDIYSAEKIKVEFIAVVKDKSEYKVQIETKWVEHKLCTNQDLSDTAFDNRKTIIEQIVDRLNNPNQLQEIAG